MFKNFLKDDDGKQSLTTHWSDFQVTGKTQKRKNCFKDFMHSYSLRRTNTVTWKVAASPMLILSAVPEALYCREGDMTFGNTVSLKIIG